MTTPDNMAVSPVEQIDSQNAAVMMVHQQPFPRVFVPQCNTCKSKYRNAIEKAMISGGLTLKAIVDKLPKDEGVSVESLKTHYERGHMEEVVAQRKAMIDRWAAERGKQIESGIDSLITSFALAEEVMKITFKRLVDGEIEPTIAEGLQAAKFLEQYEQSKGSDLDQSSVMQAFVLYTNAAKRFMTPENYRAFLMEMAKESELLSSLVDKKPAYLEAEAEEELPALEA